MPLLTRRDGLRAYPTFLRFVKVTATRALVLPWWSPTLPTRTDSQPALSVALTTVAQPSVMQFPHQRLPRRRRRRQRLPNHRAPRRQSRQRQRPAPQRFAEWGVGVPPAISRATGKNFLFAAVFAFRRTQTNTRTTAGRIQVMGRRSTPLFPRFPTSEEAPLSLGRVRRSFAGIFIDVAEQKCFNPAPSSIAAIDVSTHMQKSTAICATPVVAM